jgi:hypothetical protein
VLTAVFPLGTEVDIGIVHKDKNKSIIVLTRERAKSELSRVDTTLTPNVTRLCSEGVETERTLAPVLLTVQIFLPSSTWLGQRRLGTTWHSTRGLYAPAYQSNG